MKTVNGFVKLVKGNGEDGVGLPTVTLNDAQIDPNNKNGYTISWVATNYTSIFLTVTVGNDTQTLDFLNTDQNYSSIKDKDNQTVITVTAKNSIGEVSKSKTLSKAAPEIIQDGGLINNFSISRVSNSYDLVSFEVKLNNLETFVRDPFPNLYLLYRSEKTSNWNRVKLPGASFVNNKDSIGNVLTLSLFYTDFRVVRQSIGANFNFKVEISTDILAKEESPVITLFFDSQSAPPSKDPGNTVKEAKIVDQNAPALLRYEIQTVISEKYLSLINRSESSAPETFQHAFQDYNKFKGISENEAANSLGGSIFDNGEDKQIFLYEYNSIKNNQGETKGYFYPACVSQILPYIVTESKNYPVIDSVLLFWKICDNFFDYSFFGGRISVTTVSLVVDIKRSGTTLISNLSLTSDKNFDLSSGKFIVRIDRKDALNTTIFDQISDADNYTNALTVEIVSHSVDCFSQLVNTTRRYTFDKLLIPPSWTHIVYDKYLSNKYKDSDLKNISIAINDPIARGIVIPDKAFKTFDSITRVATHPNGISIVEDIKILYKLTCETKVFYEDPVLIGTINSVEIPVIPSDVFLIAPKVVIPAPNLDSGGTQAEASVRLNEYGKIAGIEITDPGYGYSYFTSAANKRIQTFSDYAPVVKSNYTILASNRFGAPSFLVPSNSSFSRLKASLEGGVRLNSVLEDSKRSLGISSKDQKTVDFYLQRNGLVAPPVVDYSEPIDRPYSNTSEVSSLGILDETWSKISSLYADRAINPLDGVSIYNTQVDPGAASLDDSPSNSTLDSSVSSIESTTAQPIAVDSSPVNGFVLNDLPVVPDSSAAVSMISRVNAPPWLTLLPLGERADGGAAYGVLPNMLPRAELYNRLSIAINSLDEVRAILPMVWLVDEKDKLIKYFSKDTADFTDTSTITFAQNGERIDYSKTISYFQPINSAIGVSALREIKKEFTSTNQDSQKDIYKVSTELGQAVSFKPAVHPAMNSSISDFLMKGFKRKYLAVVKERQTSCSNENGETINGQTIIYVTGPNGESVQKGITLTTVPTDKNNYTTSFKIIEYGGGASLQPNGTSQSISIPRADFGSSHQFDSISCGNSAAMSYDFRYTNLFPGIIKL